MNHGSESSLSVPNNDLHRRLESIPNRILEGPERLSVGSLMGPIGEVLKLAT
jgi:hypothetical protein